MLQKRNPERRGPQSREAERVMCADDYYRTSYLANEALTCGKCGAVIHPGERFTKRGVLQSVAVRYDPGTGEAGCKQNKQRSPVCRRCGPFHETIVHTDV